ncbi:MAG: AAA family ATPase [Desulfosarcinaceae bacterium]
MKWVRVRPPFAVFSSKNSRLESLQLLRAINSEFGIRSRDREATLKDLLDDLNAFLIKKRTDDKRILLFIDEAQNLSTANLELIRMLSNLETTRSKLLQIILVGQPELSEKLERHDLRQLRQRINLTCYLVPLGRRETRAYVNHRVGIAAQKQLGLFTAGAHRAIFKYSEGVPRRINIVCDRALLAAYSNNQRRVTRATVRTVVRELQIAPPAKPSRQRVSIPPWATILGVLLLFLLILQLVLQLQYARQMAQGKRGTASAVASVRRYPVVDPEASPAPRPTERPWPEVVATLDPGRSRHASLVHMLNLWQISPGQIISDFGTGTAAAFFRLSALRYDLQVQVIEGDLALVRRLNRPAILALRRPEGAAPGFAVLTHMADDTATIRGGNVAAAWEQKVAIEDLMAQLSGPIYLFWKDFLSDPGTIPVSSAPETVIALKLLLREMGHADIKIAPVYDALTEQAVRQVQIKYGLKVDGLVGPMTKICLYNDNPKLWQPRLGG